MTNAAQTVESLIRVAEKGSGATVHEAVTAATQAARIARILRVLHQAERRLARVA